MQRCGLDMVQRKGFRPTCVCRNESLYVDFCQGVEYPETWLPPSSLSVGIRGGSVQLRLILGHSSLIDPGDECRPYDSPTPFAGP